MAESIANTQVGELTLMDGFLIGASKLVTEAGFNMLPYVNGTSYTSGLVKVGAAIALSMVSKNHYVKIVQTGILMDGVEDIWVTTRDRYMNKSSSASSPFVNTFA